MRSYRRRRDNLKSDPEVYSKYKENDKIKSRMYRLSLSPQTRHRQADKSRLRMAKMRARKKEMGTCTKMRVVTRQERINLRKTWRTAKQLQRSRQSKQSKSKELVKRKERYISKAKRMLFSKSKSSADEVPPQVETIVRMIDNVTPRKKVILKKRGLVCTPKTRARNILNTKVVNVVKDTLHTLKVNRTKPGRVKYRSFVASIAKKYSRDNRLRKHLDLQFHFWKSASLLDYEQLPPRSDSLSLETQERVKDFYKDESTALPDRRTVNPNKLVQKVVLNKTTKRLHEEFARDNPEEVPMSLTKFRDLRPQHCLTADNIQFTSCLCEYCVNAELKLKTLNGISKKRGLSLNVKDKYELCSMTMCEKSGTYNERPCIERTCSACGVCKIKDHFSALLPEEDNKDGVTSCTWQRWNNAVIVNTSGKSTRRKMLQDFTGSITECIDQLCEEVSKLSRHLFVAHWQQAVFKRIRQDCPPGWLVSVVDFAENYTCFHQDEIQSAYYHHQQITVSPLIAYYTCPKCKNSTVEESAVFVSPDIVHDSHAVKTFNNIFHGHIQKRGVVFHHAVQFSDGCASQFKSKRPFQDVSEHGVDGMIFERVYFGSRHGKNMCDALGGLVKKSAERLVKSRLGCIRTAKEMYDFCNTKLVINPGEADTDECIHERRVFFYVDSINRPEDASILITLKGTHKVQSVRSVKPGVIEARNLACLCEGCKSGTYDLCVNKPYIDNWEEHILDPKLKQPRGTKRVQKTMGTRASKKSKTKTKTTKMMPAKSERKSTKARKILSTLAECKNIRVLENEASLTELAPLPEGPTNFGVANSGLVVDKTSLALKPDDMPLGTCLYPVTIIADGNCLPRCGSLLSYGTEDHHAEIRARIVVEMATNRGYYTSNKNVVNPDNADDQNVTKKFAMYSEYFKVGESLTRKSIGAIYDRETMGVIRDGAYMGLWQLAALATVLNRSIFSVYPDYAGNKIRGDTHRLFHPRTIAPQPQQPAYIMWTSTTGKLQGPKAWAPNHFCVMLPMYAADEGVMYMHGCDGTLSEEPEGDSWLDDLLIHLADELEKVNRYVNSAGIRI